MKADAEPKIVFESRKNSPRLRARGPFIKLLDSQPPRVLILFCMASRQRIPQNTAEYARWLADEISRRYRETWFARDTTMFVAMALEGYADWLDSRESAKLTFTVTAVDDSGHSSVIAAANNIEIAWAAYSAAIPKQTHGRLLLHQSARIIAQHPPEKPLKLSATKSG